MPLEQHTADLELSAFCRAKLLQPGWAGELSPDEYTYIKRELQRSSYLRRRWGFRPSARRLGEQRIRALARYGLPAADRAVLASVPKG